MSYKNLVEYKASKRHAVCAVCNRKIENGEMVWIIPAPEKGANGGVAYAHDYHADLRWYHDGSVKQFTAPTNYRGNLKKDGLLFAPEIEVVYRDYPITVNGIEIECARHALVYVAAVWGLRWTEDGTVDAEGNLPPDTTANGWRDRISHTLKVFDTNNSSVGTHVTIGFAESREYIPNFDEENSTALLSYLASKHLATASRDEMEMVFGRYFAPYAKYTDAGFYHGDWANIRENGSIEFRICKMSKVTQFMRAIEFCKKFVLIIKGLDNEEYGLEDAYKKIDRLWKKAVNGKLTCEKTSKFGDELDRERKSK